MLDKAVTLTLMATLVGCGTTQYVEVLVPCVKTIPERATVAAPPPAAPVEVKAKQLAIYAEEADKHIERLEADIRVCIEAGTKAAE